MQSEELRLVDGTFQFRKTRHWQMNVNPHKTLIPFCLKDASAFPYNFIVTLLLK